MTRRKSLTTGLFGMPQALTEAALTQLTPAQRDTLRSDQAGDIMRLMVDTAEKVGRIVERPRPGSIEDINRG
jgi:hypothetical protein